MLQYTIFSFSKQLENIRGSDLPDSNALNNQLGSLTKEVIEFCQSNDKHHSTLNRSQKTLHNIDNLLEPLCYGNGQQKS